MQFRKKAIVIEAFRWTGGPDQEEAPVWAVDAIKNGIITVQPGRLTIKTLEGEMQAAVGDWIIRGVKGELYPCKPDIFSATYECAEIDLDAADFSDALMWLKDGQPVMRRGWNGAGQYVILIPGEHLARSAGYGFGEALGEYTFGSVLSLKNAQNIMQPGWVPSMGDLMANDWQIAR